MEKIQNLLKTTTDSVSNVVKTAANAAQSLATSSFGEMGSKTLSTTSDMAENVYDSAQSVMKQFLTMANENRMILATVAAVSLLVFCGKVSLKVPTAVLNLMNNSNVRMVAVFGVAYLATKDPTTAILATMALMLVFNKLAIYRNNKKIVKALKGSDLKKLDSTESSTASPEGATNDIEGAPLSPKADAADSSSEESTKPVTEPASTHEIAGYGGDDYASLE
jgi:hypothetical protein